MILSKKAADSKYKAITSIVYLIAISFNNINPFHTLFRDTGRGGGVEGGPEESVGGRMSLNPSNHHIDTYYLRRIELFLSKRPATSGLFQKFIWEKFNLVG